jgi:zinc transporter ZupT
MKSEARMANDVTSFLPIIFACVALCSTGLGGVTALKFRDHLHILLGFSSGAVIGVALFDILPEVFALGHGRAHMTIAAAGFLAFFGLERYAAMNRVLKPVNAATSSEQNLGLLAACGLCLHSFLDGVAIGVGFQSATKLGLLIAFGIIAHDVSDGLNTVSVVLAHGNPRCRAQFWLIVDMLSPVLGAAITLLVNLNGLLPWVMAFFAGSFIYIGASDLLPEAKEHDSPFVGVAVMTGMLAIFLTTQMLKSD